MALGSVGRAVVMVWAGEPTRARMSRASAAVLQRAARAQPRPIGIVTVVEHGAPVPRVDDLEHAVGLLASAAHQLAGWVFVLEGGGEWASEALDATVVAHARAGDAVARKYCVGTREASAWLSARVQDGEDAPTREELLEGIEAIRAALRR